MPAQSRQPKTSPDATPGATPHPGATERRLNVDGSLDEVVAWGFVHLEQMSATHWMLLIDTIDGQRIRVPIWSKATVRAFAERDGDSTLAVPLVDAVERAIESNRRRINRNRKKAGLPPYPRPTT